MKVLLHLHLDWILAVLYKINDQFNISLVITDINSKYKWDSSPVYGQDGTSPTDNFPNLRKIGVVIQIKIWGF